jgi:hypothetical protein
MLLLLLLSAKRIQQRLLLNSSIVQGKPLQRASSRASFGSVYPRTDTEVKPYLPGMQGIHGLAVAPHVCSLPVLSEQQCYLRWHQAV